MVKIPFAGLSGADNPGLYSRVQQAMNAVGRSNAGRLSRAQDNAWKYRLGMERERSRAEAELDAEEDAARDGTIDAASALSEVERRKAAEDAEVIAARKASQPQVQAIDESAQWRYGPLGFSRGGYAGLVDERIEAARAAGAFKNNKWRGKPLKREADDMNPFLSREEFFMNRIIKRQGSAPPWVELGGDLEREINSFRSRLTENWVRRATRFITSTDALKRDCDPLPVDVVRHVEQNIQPEVAPLSKTATAGSTVAAKPGMLEKKQLEHLESFVQSPDALPGHGMLLETCKSYRDPEWLYKEHKIQAIEIMDINVKIRRYNGLAPYPSRRSLLDRDIELERLFEESAPKVAISVSQELRNEREGRPSGFVDRQGFPLKKKEKPSLDFWGNEIKPAESQAVETDFFDLQPVRGTADRGDGGAGGPGSMPGIHGESGSEGVGILLLLRRTTDWVRSRVGV